MLDSRINFRFRWIDAKGNEIGFFSSKVGHFDGKYLQLDEKTIPVEQIVAAHSAEQFLFVSWLDPEKTAITESLKVISGSAADLRNAINVVISAIAAELDKKELSSKGLLHTHRSHVCKRCGSTNVLSKFPVSPQVYCNFCENLETVENPQKIKFPEYEYCICDKCGMYAKPEEFTLFYFYFLVYLYGWSYNKVRKCAGCMRSELLKLWVFNLPFVLGVPNAVIQTVRTLRSNVNGPFKGLDVANIKASKGRVDEAIKIYSEIQDNLDACAGIKYNLARGLAAKGDLDHAVSVFELALDDCANYLPAARWLVSLYTRAGSTDKLTELYSRFGTNETNEEASQGTE